MYNMDFNEGLSGVWKLVGGAFGDNIKQGLGVFVAIAVISVLIGVANAAFSGAEDVTQSRVPIIVGILAIAGVCIGNVNSLFGVLTKTLSEIDVLSKTLLPTLTAAMTAAGTPTSAVVKSSAIMLFSDVLITIINRLLLPCTYTYLALITANAALGNDSLAELSRLLKSGVTGVLKLLLTLFIAYITVSGAISGTSDIMLEKSAKLAMTGAVPVVGSIISEASQTVIAGAGILRNSIGVFGIIAVLGFTIGPTVRIVLNMLALRFAAAVSAPVAPEAIVKYIEKLSEVFSLMLGMTVASVLVLFIGIVSCMGAF